MELTKEQLTSEISKFKGYLERAGWGPCNADACNCNGWHKVRQSQAERELEDEISKLKSEVERLKESFWENEADIKSACGQSHMSYPAINAVKELSQKLAEWKALTDHVGNDNPADIVTYIKALNKKLAEVEKERDKYRHLFTEAKDGYNGLEEELSSAEQLVCKMREALEKCRKCSCGRKQQMERDDLSNLGGWVLPHADDCASSIAIEALSLSAPIAGKYVRKEEA